MRSKLYLLPLRSVYGPSLARSRVGGVGGIVLREGCNRSVALLRTFADLNDEFTADTDRECA